MATLTLTASERRVLWKRAALDASNDELEHAFVGLDRDEEPRIPDRMDVANWIHQYKSFAVLFDLLGWERDDRREQITITDPPNEFWDALAVMENGIVTELEDRDSTLVRLSEKLLGDEWVIEGDDRRGLGDELLEQRYTIQQVRQRGELEERAAA